MKDHLHQTFIRFTKFFTILLFATHSHVLAEENIPTETNSFSCALFTQLPEQAIYFKYKEFFLPIKLIKNKRSTNYKLPANSFFELYTREVGDKDTFKYTMIGKSTSPCIYKHSLFLIQKAVDEDFDYHIFVTDDSIETFKINDTKIINLTKEDLNVDYNHVANVLAPDTSVNVHTKVSPKGVFLPFTLKNSNDQILKATRLYTNDASRKMIVIYPPMNKRSKIYINYLNQLARSLKAG